MKVVLFHKRGGLGGINGKHGFVSIEGVFGWPSLFEALDLLLEGFRSRYYALDLMQAKSLTEVPLNGIWKWLLCLWIWIESKR